MRRRTQRGEKVRLLFSDAVLRVLGGRLYLDAMRRLRSDAIKSKHRNVGIVSLVTAISAGKQKDQALGIGGLRYWVAFMPEKRFFHTHSANISEGQPGVEQVDR